MLLIFVLPIEGGLSLLLLPQLTEELAIILDIESISDRDDHDPLAVQRHLIHELLLAPIVDDVTNQLDFVLTFPFQP